MHDESGSGDSRGAAQPGAIDATLAATTLSKRDFLKAAAEAGAAPGCC